MKAILQRVMKASVTVNEETVGSIGRGWCVLVGIHRNDTEKEMKYIVRKILNTRAFPSEDQSKKWDRSIMDLDLEVLCVSQFTLDSTLKGNKLDFRLAMTPELAKGFYQRFLEELKSQYKPEKIQDGAFGEYMQVHIQNDGPVTIQLEQVPEKVNDSSESKNSQKKSDKGASTEDQGQES